MMDYTILLVDDELEMCLSLSELLDDEGYCTRYTTDPLETLRILKQDKIDLIIMDVKMPEISGIDLLQQVKKLHESIAILMISGYPTVENAVKSIKYGAVNFYVKPLKLDEMLKEIHELAAKQERKRQNLQHGEYTIVTADLEMQKILDTIKKAAPTPAPVLITGESGTGKELVAHAIHHQSLRTKEAFVKINCAALPEELLESELFGHERGAFTGALKERKGRFELADRGTIFLDEIGDMSLKTQAKILRVLQEKEFERVGGIKTLKTDIRIIAATNKPFKRMIAEGSFREDLYYRLSVITMHLPPLRERPKDILLLATHYIYYYNGIYHKAIQGITDEVLTFFQRHKWPGNVRELKNCIERSVIFCEQSRIGVEDLATQYAELIVECSAPESYEQAFESLNREVILDALDRSGGVKQKAANLLNISRRTLYNRMKKLGLQ